MSTVSLLGSSEVEAGLEQDDGLYATIHPQNVQDCGRCFYCGCEYEHLDYVPPIRYAEFYIRNSEPSAFCKIPSCRECFQWLEHCRAGLLEDRKKHVNQQISRKYKKALNIYERWDERELVDLDVTLVSSIEAGLRLGAEASDRLRFRGFSYDTDRDSFIVSQQKAMTYTVFGERFMDFRTALQYAASASGININALRDWIMETGLELDPAVSAWFETKEKERLKKHMDKLCKEFAAKHRQNVKFVVSALEVFMKMNPDMPPKQCLDAVYEKYIKKD